MALPQRLASNNGLKCAVYPSIYTLAGANIGPTSRCTAFRVVF